MLFVFFFQYFVDFAFDLGELLYGFFLGFFHGFQLCVCLLLYLGDSFLHSFGIVIQDNDCYDQDEEDDPEEDCSDVVYRFWNKINNLHACSPSRYCILFILIKSSKGKWTMKESDMHRLFLCSIQRLIKELLCDDIAKSYADCTLSLLSYRFLTLGCYF